MKKQILLAALLIAPWTGAQAFAEGDAMLDEARKVAMLLPPKLMATLQDEIGKTGFQGAIPVCKESAPKIAGAVSQETGWKIRRVSLKTRNETRATPDAWEKAVLEEFDKRAAAGEPPAKLEKGEKIGNEYRYAKALPVQSLCLGCHGKDEVTPAVKEVLSKTYPNDHAIGYVEGQIRGAISIRKAVP
ncbi:hypothetical protein SIID45300_02160 [Candidatus Magnetaquicoccaceae bacterium FCR-1]|uniref:Tll0287-like domain-containing protein n=1 Tax=Candidatus Magnetaquiglobus chichijimensis TaxID=3141448 RepID=A0ABQ0CAA7_9PROT